MEFTQKGAFGLLCYVWNLKPKKFKNSKNEKENISTIK